MTTQIEFFTDTELSDISKIRIYDSLQKQNDYFDSLTKVTVSGAFKGFDEPILIYEDVASAIGHSYGRFKIGTKYYYFYVVDVRQDTPGKTWIYYRLDYWETARLQFGATLGRGFITRTSFVPGCATPYDPKYYTFVKRQWISNRTNPLDSEVFPDIIFFARDSERNECRVGYIRGPFTNTELMLILNGNWMEYLAPVGISGTPYWTAADISGAWFTPPIIDIDDYTESMGWIKMAGRDGNFAGNTLVSLYPTSSQVTHFDNLIYDLHTSWEFITDNAHTTVIKDLEGNIVYQFDYGRTIEELRFELSVSPTSCKWVVYKRGSDDSVFFTFPCSTLDVFTDSYMEYFARERDFDISTRELNCKKDLVSGMSGGASGAVSGAVTGALLGSAVPGIGTAIGAIAGAGAGLIGGAITSGADAAVSTYFNPQEQAIKDRYMKNAVDPLAIVGSNLVKFLFSGSRFCGVFQYEVDPDTKSRIESDVAEFGHYTSRAVSSGEGYIADDARLKGDFVINGSIPENWKAAIQNRFSTGVHIIKRGS